MIQVRREPALWAFLLATAVQMVSAFLLPLSHDQVAAVTAVAVLVAGAITSWQVVSEKLVPFIVGCAQALITLGLAFGLVLTDEQVSLIMTFVAAIAAVIIRDRVSAPEPPVVTGPGVEPGAGP